MRVLTATTYPRAGLLGNPSDGYGGRVISFTFSDFSARVRIESGEEMSIGDAAKPDLRAEDWPTLLGDLKPTALSGGTALIAAAIKTLAESEGFPRSDIPDADQRFRISFRSDIPLRCGLSGSSAIVIAAQRALARWFRIEIPRARLAELALLAETRELGINAGPQDRVVQCYEGLMDMDFAEPVSESSYRRLDPGLLPPVFLAWNPLPGVSSGIVHAPLAERFARGEPTVLEAMRDLRRNAGDGRGCLEAGDRDGLARLVNENFRLRSTIMDIAASDRDMVDIGRGLDAAVKLCGSGGAVLGVMRRIDDFPDLQALYESRGLRIMRPRIEHPENETR